VINANFCLHMHCIWLLIADLRKYEIQCSNFHLYASICAFVCLSDCRINSPFIQNRCGVWPQSCLHMPHLICSMRRLGALFYGVMSEVDSLKVENTVDAWLCNTFRQACHSAGSICWRLARTKSVCVENTRWGNVSPHTLKSVSRLLYLCVTAGLLWSWPVNSLPLARQTATRVWRHASLHVTTPYFQRSSTSNTREVTVTQFRPYLYASWFLPPSCG